MKKQWFMAGLCLVGSLLFGQTVSLDEAIVAAVRDMESSLAKGTKVAVLNFTSESPRFSDYVIEELAGALVNGKKLVVVDRREIELIRRETNFQLSGDVSDDSAQRIGVMLGAQSIVSGSLVDTGTWFRFRVNTISVETAQRQVFTSKNISGSDGQVVFLLTGQRVAQPVTPVAPVTPAQTSMPASFVRIAGGTFTMGSPSSEVDRDSDEVQHRVTISRPFYISKYEVTVGEFRQFVNATGYKTIAETSGGGYVLTGGSWQIKADANWKNPYFTQDDNHPVVLVSWYDAVEYCNWRSTKERLTPAYTIDKTRSDGNNTNDDDNVKWVVTWNRNVNGYRLPTEAEWEFACRAGTTTPFYTGNNITTNHANYNGNYPYNNNAKGVYREKTWAVGSGTSNPWGLYDMSGNVWEWCWDWYDDYGSGAQTDPVGASSGTDRVDRGGSWLLNGQNLRSAFRDCNTPSNRDIDLGFRLARPSL
ncbi:MAG: SUMF1/EgtB/PvdO family nonheme iron enzyme [Treponema sp.]|jgi:formylglycine-generating enzyme required for sulfatase activity|nr:SUMF1/EgtB/PvdO family nonheme iron enzyme [Treponema sp.]